MFANTSKWLVRSMALLAVGSALVYAGSVPERVRSSSSQGFICPITGEVLPCEQCCPLNQEDQGFICPITGKELPCEQCCPLADEE